MHVTKTGKRNSSADAQRLDKIGAHAEAIAGHVAAIKGLHAELIDPDADGDAEGTSSDADATDDTSEKAARRGYVPPGESGILREIRKGRLK